MSDVYKSIFGVLIGLGLVIFRRSFIRGCIKAHLDKSQKGHESMAKLREMKLEGFMVKGLEGSVVVVGLTIIIMMIPGFFPSTEKFIARALGYGFITFFVFVISAVIEFALLGKLVFKDVNDYKNQYAANGFDLDEQDPVLKNMQKKALIRAAVCFVPVFGTLLFCALYFIMFE